MSGNGDYRGRHYTTWVDDVKALRRAGDEDEAEQLLLSLLDAVEAESKKERLPPPGWYYQQLAIIAAKQKDPDREVGVLERYVAAAKKRADPDLLERLRKARAKVDSASVAAEPAVCPYCEEPLSPPPTRSRKCPACRVPIVVRKRAGVTQLLTTSEAEDLEQSEQQQKAYNASLRRANELGASDDEFARMVATHGRHGDALWELCNRELLNSDGYRRKMIYRIQSDHMVDEGRDWMTSAQLGVQEELGFIDLPGDSLVAIGGCRCEVCSATPERVQLQEIRSGNVIPHPDCQNPPCKCWIHVPPETRDVANLAFDAGAPKRKGLLRRIFGGQLKRPWSTSRPTGLERPLAGQRDVHDGAPRPNGNARRSGVQRSLMLGT